MKPTTDIEQVKSVARALLMTEVNKTPCSPDSGTAPIHLVRLCGNNEGRSDAAFRHNRERRKSAGVASLYAKANKYHR